MKMKHSLTTTLVVTSLAFSSATFASDTFFGAVFGAGTGALLGNAVGGRNGAIVGGALGAAAGATIASERRETRVVYQKAPVYYTESYYDYAPPPPPPRYISQPVYYANPVVVAPAPVYYVNYGYERNYWRGHDHWDNGYPYGHRDRYYEERRRW